MHTWIIGLSPCLCLIHTKLSQKSRVSICPNIEVAKSNIFVYSKRMISKFDCIVNSGSAWSNGILGKLTYCCSCTAVCDVLGHLKVLIVCYMDLDGKLAYYYMIKGNLHDMDEHSTVWQLWCSCVNKCPLEVHIY